MNLVNLLVAVWILGIGGQVPDTVDMGLVGIVPKFHIGMGALVLGEMGPVSAGVRTELAMAFSC